MVSNSVENLLPENISVVDTEGRVLSTGVIDRMTKKIEAIQNKAKQMPTQVGNGQVIIPVIEDVVDWFQLKFNYETVLEKKALNQLNGVLPVGSYKTAVTIDLNSVSKTGAPDIKQIVTSVVVDEQFEEVELNDDTLNQIKQAVAGAIGFVEGRDQIHISKAAFLPKRTILDDSEPLQKKVLMPKDSLSDKFSRVARLWPIFGIGCLISTILIVVFAFLQSTVMTLLSGLKAIGSLFKRKPKPVEDVVETDDVDEPESEEAVVIELNETEVLNNLKANSNFAQVIQLKAMSTQELESVVEELKAMVKGN